MKLDISQGSFDIVKLILSQTYVELTSQRELNKSVPAKNRVISDTAEAVRTALREIGIKILPTKIELDKEGNFK